MKRLTIFFGVAAILCFAAINFVEYTMLQPLSGGLQSPDLRANGYSVAEFTTWRDALDKSGQEIYLRYLPGGLDMFLPVLFGATMFLLLFTLLSAFPRYAALHLTVKIIVPLALVSPYVFLDYAENSTMYDLVSEPTRWGDDVIQLASTLTVSKFISLALPLITIIAFALARLRNKSTAST